MHLPRHRAGRDDHRRHRHLGVRGSHLRVRHLGLRHRRQRHRRGSYRHRHRHHRDRRDDHRRHRDHGRRGRDAGHRDDPSRLVGHRGDVEACCRVSLRDAGRDAGHLGLPRDAGHRDRQRDAVPDARPAAAMRRGYCPRAGRAVRAWARREWLAPDRVGDPVSDLPVRRAGPVHSRRVLVPRRRVSAPVPEPELRAAQAVPGVRASDRRAWVPRSRRHRRLPQVRHRAWARPIRTERLRLRASPVPARPWRACLHRTPRATGAPREPPQWRMRT
jgi:hypothetical protein